MIHLEKYILHDKIFIHPDRQHFEYSDGDEQEEYLLEVITASNDLSTGSEELSSKIRDWNSQCHLSPKRANLLRPLAQHMKNSDVLEIGSGCGAISRYLGELGCNLVALEGSPRRATITAERCRDLPGVNVVCDNFEHFSINHTFDIIILIGVLEYSPLFIEGGNPVQSMLKKCKQILKPGGKIIIAIENKLGLKYFAGAPEDHTGHPFFGIENHYSDKTAITFGKQEIIGLLKESGFSENSFLYPFPDYKLPSMLVSEAGFRNPDFNVASLLLENFQYVQQLFYSDTFNCSLAAHELAKNELLEDLSNSFLVIGSASDFPAPVIHQLAFSYSSNRSKPYCKNQEFVADPVSGKIKVTKEKTYKEVVNPSEALEQVLEEEPYYHGNLLQEQLVRIISRKNWTAEELDKWADIYHSFLETVVSETEEGKKMEGRYVDLTPFNIIVSENGELSAFDLEWKVNESLPADYIFFRGIYYSIGQLYSLRLPAYGTPGCTLDLTIRLVEPYYKLDYNRINLFRTIEKRLFSSVWVHDYDPFMPQLLKTRPDDNHEVATRYEEALKKFALLEESNKDIQELLNSKNELIAELNKINQLLENHQSQSEEKIIQLHNQMNAFYKSNETLNDQLNTARVDFENLKQDAEETIKLLQKQLIRKTLNLSMDSQVPVLKPETGKLEDKMYRTLLEQNQEIADNVTRIQELQNEIERQKNTINWYQSTYEKRSLMGIVYEKLIKK
jgi:SAM-dependent methyltransferase